MDANEEAGNQYLSRNEWKELHFSFLASPALPWESWTRGRTGRAHPSPTANSTSGLLSSHTTPSALGVAFQNQVKT